MRSLRRVTPHAVSVLSALFLIVPLIQVELTGYGNSYGEEYIWTGIDYLGSIYALDEMADAVSFDDPILAREAEE